MRPNHGFASQQHLMNDARMPIDGKILPILLKDLSDRSLDTSRTTLVASLCDGPQDLHHFRGLNHATIESCALNDRYIAMTFESGRVVRCFFQFLVLADG